MSSTAGTRRVGEMRPSQLLLTYGVGAILDLPNISAMVMGLEDWPVASAVRITEERLLAAVRKELGSQVLDLMAPPPAPEVSPGAMPDETANTIGVPVAPFPRWLLCPYCRLLSPIGSGLFELKTFPFRPERAHYLHKTCRTPRPPAALPVRFLTACERGHLDDFPWDEFVHQGARFPNHELQFVEQGVGGEAADVMVRCVTCDSGRSLAQAFEKSFQLGCTARRPQLRDFEPSGCKERMRPILLGASNSWFPVPLSALTVPQAKDKLPQLVEEYWSLLQKATSPVFIEAWRLGGQLNAFAKYSDAQIWDAVEAKRSGGGPTGSEDLKTPEYRVFTNPSAAASSSLFRVREVAPPGAFSWCIEKVVLAERLREVRALIGFTRIESPNDADDGLVPSERRGPISRSAPKWVPASEIRGEGLFLQFREEEIVRWVGEQTARDAEFFSAHKRWRALRRIPNPEGAYAGMRFTLLHSFSHALIRQFALECGYSAASLRERIYSRNADEENGPMAGILIYTAAPDSEGTLGGLVALGEPDALGRHIENALAAMKLCTSDPLCAEHNPPQDGLTLHGAACHACLFASETWCERGNRYLDRSVLVPTVERSDLAFFRD